MTLGQIVIEKELSGRRVTIRYMNKDDAEPMRRYMNKLSKEQTFITYQGEEITAEEEQKYVEETIKKMENGVIVKLLLLVDDVVVGTTEVGLGTRTHTHVGGLGLSVDFSVRGLGLGRLLLETVIAEAKKELKGLRMIELSVFAINDIAISLYKSYGFQEVGRVPNKIFYKGEYVDEVIMCLQV